VPRPPAGDARAWLTYAPERDAIGVEPKRRGAVIDDALPLLRRLWAGETVSHDGAAGAFRDVKLSPLPVQQPLEVWLGGNAPAALERCGRLSDGWLPSLLTPEEAAARTRGDRGDRGQGGTTDQQRSTSRQHRLRPRADRRGDGAHDDRAPPAIGRAHAVGLPALRERIERFVAVGFSKFVVRPIVPPVSWRAELDALAAAVGDLQT